MSESFDAVVVGSGPNGLTAAALLAKAGRSVLVLEAAGTPGGGARTQALTLPGFLHDVCSAVHPMAAMSPAFAELGLEDAGMELVQPDIPLAHPLDGGRAAILYRSLEETCTGLGEDGNSWRRQMQPFVSRFEEMKPLLLAPVLRVPTAPLLAARFGLRALRSALNFAASTFDTDEAQGLFAGCAAHSFSALEKPLTASLGMVLALAGHAVGWPVIRGGSVGLVSALMKVLQAHGGELRCGVNVTSLAQLPKAKAVFFDTTPQQLSRIAGEALPPRFHRQANRFRPGPGVFKIDYALAGPVPWTNAAVGRAGTVHLGGTLNEVARSESAVSRGEVPEHPYVLVAQQSAVDPSRAPAGKQTLWAYCHVPNGCDLDMTERIEAQLERFAPGFTDRVLARATRGPHGYEAYNANYIGGDISAGGMEGMQLLFRPRLALDPYRTPNPKLFLCSASTPPGPGVHGMGGYWAVKSALKNALR